MRDNSNDFLRKAKKNKNDVFYTQMIDIERELKYYTNQFSGKIVYCNCGVSGGMCYTKSLGV